MQHLSVLLTEVIEYLVPRPTAEESRLHFPPSLASTPEAWWADLTVGGGGHTEALLEATAPRGRVFGLDQDSTALSRAGQRLEKYSARLLLVQGNFRDLDPIVREHHLPPLSGALMDLGVSSFQLEEGARGFSFLQPGPLDMRMDQHQSLTAAEIVNHWDEASLARIFWEWGEERHARRLARLIVKARPFTQTHELAALVQRAVGRFGRIHPATRIFQALRIAVNDELNALQQALPALENHLQPGGRLVVISFHSLEDRIVKHHLRRPGWQAIQRRVVRPGLAEIHSNPRARSARLRAAIWQPENYHAANEV